VVMTIFASFIKWAITYKALKVAQNVGKPASIIVIIILYRPLPINAA
jgi:hypothetical protein